MKNRIVVAGICLSSACFVSSTIGQTAATQEILVLDPFTVTTTKDVGYKASSTLAGSRLNGELRDTAASISVMTPEFLADIGAASLQEAILYANNLQVNVSDEVAGNANGNSTTEFPANYRMRGIKADVARNYFVWNLPSDIYNIERVDESRGPNSILFGIGSAGGIINSSTKQAKSNRDSFNFSAVVSSHDSLRGTIDLNKVLIPGKLAVRINAVKDDSKTFRHFEYNKTSLADIAITAKLSKNTTIKGEMEIGEIRANRARPWGMIDLVSVWEAAGKNTPAVAAANAALGIGRFATATSRVTYIEERGGILDMKGAMNTTVPTTLSNVIISSLPSSINPSGPGETTVTSFHNYTASLEQKLPKQTYFQLSYNHQDYDFLGYDINTGDAHNLSADPNASLAGSVNPNAGRYYIETNWFRRHRKEEFDTLRATLASTIEGGKLGRHRVAAMAERQWSNFWRDERREYWAGTPFNALPENTANLVFRRHYVTPGDYSTYRANGGAGQLIQSMTDPVTGKTLSSAWIQNNTNIDDDPAGLTTYLVGDQSYFFNNKLVLTGGFRYDSVHVDNRNTSRDPSTQEIIVDYANVEYYKASARTKTYGGVYHATEWLTVFANKSDSINLPNGAHRVLPSSGRAPTWKGEGQDYGLLLELADGKYVLRATRFETSAIGETNFRNVIGIVTNRNTRVLAALQSAGQITAADVTARTVNVNTGVSDRDSNGYEFSFTANPTRQWRMSVNYSLTDAVESNIFPEVKAWAEDAITFWNTKNTALATSAGITIAQEIANLRDDMLAQTSVEGIAEVGNRRHKLSAFTRYDLEGRAKGFFIGGGWRYQSRVMMGLDSAKALQYGNAATYVDLLLGYKGKIFSGRCGLQVQLNIANLLDNDDALIYRRSLDNLYVTRSQLVDGRTFRLTTTLSF